MKLANHTYLFGRFFEADPLKTIEAYSKTKFKYVDYTFFTRKEYPNQPVENYQEVFQKTRRYADEHGLQFVQAHAPCGDPFATDGSLPPYIEDIIRSFYCCKILGIPHAVVHTGLVGFSKDEFFEKNLAFIKNFYPVMEETGVELLIENTCYENTHGGKYDFIDYPEMLEFIKEANHPLVKAVWDVGHGNLVPTPQEENIRGLGDMLRGLHVHDSIDADWHLFPLMGTTDYEGIVRGLKDINYKGHFTFEVSGFLKHIYCYKPSPYINKSIFGKNGEFQPSVQIVQKLCDFMWEVGKEILTTYDCFEE